MFGRRVEPHPIRAWSRGGIAQGEEQLVFEIDVSETKNTSHSGAQWFQLIDDEGKRQRPSWGSGFHESRL